MTTKTSIWITTSFIGYHQWPDAPDSHSYLSNKHRHKFGVRVEVPINKDRGIEFHWLQEYVISLLDISPKGVSCETLATWLATKLMDHLLVDWTIVSVDEDGENGSQAVITREI